jgi:DNA-directed RNA polymerase subunit M/transcription elongation factor TFIIS
MSAVVYIVVLRQLSDTASKTITSEFKPTAFPFSLRSKRSAVQTLVTEDRRVKVIIQETCPECGRPEMRYYTLQLRSADEGSTVFYSCECGYKYVLYFPRCPFRNNEQANLFEILGIIQQLSRRSAPIIYS